jgi:hypothetical protein
LDCGLRLWTPTLDSSWKVQGGSKAFDSEEAARDRVRPDAQYGYSPSLLPKPPDWGDHLHGILVRRLRSGMAASSKDSCLEQIDLDRCDTAPHLEQRLAF